MELSKQYSNKHMLLLFLSAFILRSILFYFYIFPSYRYNQPDTKDYHICAISLADGNGMKYYKSERPIFWRTPGYPLLLAPFYKYFATTDEVQLIHYRNAHWLFLWLQIFICSFLPVIIFFLALLLTKNIILSWIASFLSVFHLGFTLSSTYLMTDGLTCIFFLLFLFYFYRSISLPFEEKKESGTIKNICVAALSLSICTWLRPMGIYVSFVSAFLILISQFSWKKKFQILALFLTLFFGSLSPWYIRNYMLTGSVFFCPLWGPYTLTFLVPKIYQRLNSNTIPLTQCIKKFLKEAHYASQKDIKEKQLSGSPFVSCKELICAQIAQPWIINHPWYFILDWTIEIIKTTCDLYSGHLVNFVRNNFNTEPPVEFLNEKLKDCLYREKMSFGMRVICWVEAFFHLSILFALFAGLFFFVFVPLFQITKHSEEEKKRLAFWLKTGIFIALIIGMTGGFGYARLRLPVEALMIILALDFYQWLFSGTFVYTSKKSIASKQNILIPH